MNLNIRDAYKELKHNTNQNVWIPNRYIRDTYKELILINWVFKYKFIYNIRDTYKELKHNQVNGGLSECCEY